MKKIILGLLALAVSTYAQSWEYTPGPVPINGQVTIACGASGTFDVYHKNKKVETGNDFTVTKTATRIEVIIKKVTEYFAGEYICRLSGGADAKVFVSISVSFPNNKETFSKTIGSKATVEFYVVGIRRPAINYYRKTAGGSKGDKIVDISTTGVVTKGTGGERFSIDSTKGYLIIDNVQSSDGGSYLAEVRSLGVLHSGEFTLVVGEKPKIVTAPAKEYNVTSGESATLPCSFEKAPTKLKWIQTKSSGNTVTIMLTSAPGSVANLDLEGTNLKIRKADVTMEGDKFECIGENTFGNATAQTMIKVVYVQPKIEALSNVSVVSNTDKSLACKASGNPKPVVAWSKKGADGKYAVLSQQVQTPGASEYKIVKAKQENAGDYQCEAKLAGKPALKDVQKITVTLQTPPQIVASETTKKQQYPVGKAESKDLICAATGSPSPVIMFMKGGKALTGGTPSSKDGMNIMTLAYTANATTDAGIIECMAKSSIGSASANITIEMIDKPAAPTGLASVKIENDYVTLSWNPVAGAKEYVVFADGTAVKTIPQTKDVKIESLVGAKTYSFSVAARNDAGLGQKSAPVNVKTLKYGLPSKPRPDPKGPPQSFANVDASFQWQAPVDNGGDQDLSYVIEYCAESVAKTYPKENCKTVTSNTTEVSIKGLEENKKYRFTVSVKNARGTTASDPFYASTGYRKGQVTTKVPTSSKPEKKAKTGLGGGAIAGIIVAVILILLIVIDLFCCFFNECGFTHCCYQACCAGKGKGKYSAAESNDAEKGEELKETGNNHDAEVKTAPEEKEEKEPAKEKKTEDV